MDTKEEDGMICKKITGLLIRTSLSGSDNLCHNFEFGSVRLCAASFYGWLAVGVTALFPSYL